MSESLGTCEVWKCRRPIVASGTWAGMYVHTCYTHMHQMWTEPRPPVKAKALFREQFRNPVNGFLEGYPNA